jgi:hypothetical protein
MNRLLQVTGQVHAALASLAEDQPDVQNTLAKLPQVVVVGSQVRVYVNSREHRQQK